MAATSSTGEDLTEKELEAVNEACDTALVLDESRQKILSYVEGRMQVFAPNLTALVGSEIATKLIGAAGGLLKLATMPSNTLFVLGRKRTTLEGFSSATAVKHCGYVSLSEIVQKSPAHLEIKSSRLVANKASLAARLDISRDEYTQGEMGQKFREEIEKKIEKWMEPPPKQKEKVLPAPDDVPRKRRGGARMRKYKQRYALTEMRKRAMRLPFGHITEEVGNSMKSLGMLGVEGSGIIRVHAKEDKGFQPRVAKRKKHQKGNQSTPGFATSVYAMTPFQGLELPTPDASKDKPQDNSDGYFSTTGGFLQVGQKKEKHLIK
jgi:U4/U6 small nuclear ribonucleoprotein PRP31